MKPLLSILICTIEGREQFFKRLLNVISSQVVAYNIKNDVEVLYYKDKRGEHTIGEKRNELLQSANGLYTRFVDDDDLISSTSIVNELAIIKSQQPDCINLVGEMILNGRIRFIHELAQKEYNHVGGIYYRPPNHLNVIKSSISKQFYFPSLNHGEDTDWAMQICRSGILKTEGRIEDVSYFYYPSKN